MKLPLLFLILLSLPVCGWGQSKPKQHIYYDTVKTVHERVDYAPDTIPVYFKELVIIKHDTSTLKGYVHGEPNAIYEIWHSGFVVWQTYKKSSAIQFSSIGSFGFATDRPQYYEDDYKPSQGLPGQFLYADKKPCKNIVLNSFKR